MEIQVAAGEKQDKSKNFCHKIAAGNKHMSVKKITLKYILHFGVSSIIMKEMMYEDCWYN